MTLLPSLPGFGKNDIKEKQRVMCRGSWKYRGVCAFEDSMFDNNFGDSAVDYFKEDFL
jgi:hypothetical protein